VTSGSALVLLRNIKLLRKRHGLTQELVAEMSGIDYKFYQAVEAGRRPNVTLSTLDQIAKVYGIPGHKLIATILPKTSVKRQQGKKNDER
jgi:transcriptional regulator with XRE-family HTH domain